MEYYQQATVIFKNVVIQIIKINSNSVNVGCNTYDLSDYQIQTQVSEFFFTSIPTSYFLHFVEIVIFNNLNYASICVYTYHCVD